MAPYPPPGRLTRKWRKFRRDPVRFFADARNPLIRKLVLWGLAGLGHRRKKSLSRRAWEYYRHNGLKRSFRVLRKKIALRKSGVPFSVQIGKPPESAISDYYLAGHQHWLEQNDIGRTKNQPKEVFCRPCVTIIGDLNLPQCKKYRVFQKCEVLSTADINVGFSHYLDIPRSLDLMQLATTVIFYRVQAGEHLTRYSLEAARLGLRTGYDIDDPIFDRDVYRKNPNLQFLESTERESLLSGSDRYFSALRGCDFAITSTPGMQSLMAGHFNGPIFLWRNVLDAETLHSASVAGMQRTDVSGRTRKDVVLTYASGSRAHEADFRVVEDALVEIMIRHPKLKFSVIGHLEIPERLQPFAGRIMSTPFSDYASYIAHLSESSILMVPLVDDPFNECKSAIRYLEGAVVGIPTVASATGDFKNIVEDGKNGFLASTTSDWVEALDSLITSQALRKKIGNSAKQHVLSTQTTSGVWQAMDKGLRTEICEGFNR